MTEGANLPALVRGIGGALVRVTSEIDAYTDDKFPLRRDGQLALGRLIEERPSLNTEPRVAMLVDVLSWHGVKDIEALGELIDEHGIDPVCVALDYLYEVGIRDHAEALEADDAYADTGSDQQHNSMEIVRSIVELITELESNRLVIPSAEVLFEIIYQRGGLRAVKLGNLVPQNTSAEI